MKNKELELNLPIDYSEEYLISRIKKKTGLSDFSYSIENKSLDARKKKDIHWNLRLLVRRKKNENDQIQKPQSLKFFYKKGRGTAVVVGSGPAGIFSALVLQESGYETTILERGSEIKKRIVDIDSFEKTAEFNSQNNYAFGEGGAGTFSDGKLTSRSKKISDIRKYILNIFIEAGAPDEISYMKHPHIGSNNLKVITKKLREKFISLGGTIIFDSIFTGFKSESAKVTNVQHDKGELATDLLYVATGHSAYDSYRTLMKHDVAFRLKSFAIGARVEHEQLLINRNQWGCDSLPGLNAAEYRLSSRGDHHYPVYTFCMCPGGTIVPAAAYGGRSVVNGMSQYNRAGKFANAACVAAVDINELSGKTLSPNDALTWLDDLEKSFYDFSSGYQLPSCSIKEFIESADPSIPRESSYRLGHKAAQLWTMLPSKLSESMRAGLLEFSKKIDGYDQGYIMGLESKTSSPIQVIREESGLCAGFENLYVIGESSGLSGGIISSSAVGIRMVLNQIQ